MGVLRFASPIQYGIGPTYLGSFQGSTWYGYYSSPIIVAASWFSFQVQNPTPNYVSGSVRIRPVQDGVQYPLPVYVPILSDPPYYERQVSLPAVNVPHDYGSVPITLGPFETKLVYYQPILPVPESGIYTLCLRASGDVDCGQGHSIGQSPSTEAWVQIILLTPGPPTPNCADQGAPDDNLYVRMVETTTSVPAYPTFVNSKPTGKACSVFYSAAYAPIITNGRPSTPFRLSAQFGQNTCLDLGTYTFDPLGNWNQNRAFTIDFTKSDQAQGDATATAGFTLIITYNYGTEYRTVATFIAMPPGLLGSAPGILGYDIQNPCLA